MKVVQCFLGPTSFMLNRMLAILGVLLKRTTLFPGHMHMLLSSGEETDVEISHVAVYAARMELMSVF